MGNRCETTMTDLTSLGSIPHVDDDVAVDTLDVDIAILVSCSNTHRHQVVCVALFASNVQILAPRSVKCLHSQISCIIIDHYVAMPCYQKAIIGCVNSRLGSRQISQ